ncbi:hypothetical protein PFDG_04688 [Plasmodium falciparum Dd2]|uniref:Uncharacterized protein n=1 Tax=Plasmodium falciparum (isolate Dd2) TaxID=57267 RepID=A0A0L7M5T0_PLAF4|nr:hypothetical protein PFDG_04688 [Plasmodium falciparum Dd2]
MRNPTDWLVEGTNIVILFDEFGGNPYKVEIVREILHGALHNYFKTKEEKERNKQNYQNIIENIITHNIYINSSYDDITEETNTENIQNSHKTKIFYPSFIFITDIKLLHFC